MTVPGPPSRFASSGDAAFDGWRDEFYRRAVAAGVPGAVAMRELAGLVPDQRTQTSDSKQPEFSKPVGDYVKAVVSDTRIAQGQQFRATLPYLSALEQQYGVPRDVILAIWAMESAFGKIQGDMDVVRSLSSLAFEGRRRAWAESELIAALKIIGSGEASRAQLKGSWAGAMGQTQFLPSVFLSTAVDGDGDGKRDIWGSTQDALASTGNYMKNARWQPGVSWSREVRIPAGFDYSVTEGPRQSPAWWAERGVVRADGQAWSAADQASTAQLILPSGATGPAFLIFPNHQAIMRYNNSTAYALGVGLLAIRFAGEPPLVTPWPVETPLSLTDRIAAQQALTKLGFDTGGADGAIGPKSRSALRLWQQGKAIPADGYLTTALVQQLVTEAASR